MMQSAAPATLLTPRLAADAATLHSYADPQPKRVMTMMEAEQLSRCLAAALQQRAVPADLVVGLANGALVPAHVVAQALGLPCHMVRLRRQGSRWIQRLQGLRRAVRLPTRLLTWGPVGLFWYWFQRRYNRLERAESSFDFPVAGRHVALVDDCIVSGASLRYVQQRLLQAGAASVCTAVLCWSDDTRAMDADNPIVPDIHLHRAVHFYPWSSASPHLGAFEAWLRSRGLELWT